MSDDRNFGWSGEIHKNGGKMLMRTNENKKRKNSIISRLCYKIFTKIQWYHVLSKREREREREREMFCLHKQI